MIKGNILLIAIAALVVGAAQAQSFKPPETRNAALRYWEAFALMQDQSMEPGKDLKSLTEIVNGATAWDEQLSPLVDQNMQAIQIMQRGTLLPECEWGVDYSAGSEAPMPQLAKARALARLNLLYGMRALARRDNAGTVTAFVAGIRYAQHLAQDGPIISILTATTVLRADFKIIEKAVASGQLDSQSKAKIYDAVHLLPKYGFDWAYSVRYEGFAEETALRQLAASSDPGALYQSWMGEPLPKAFVLPSVTDIMELHSYSNDVANAFEMPADAAQERLNSLKVKLKNASSIVQQVVPNFARLNDARKRLETEREALQQLK